MKSQAYNNYQSVFVIVIEKLVDLATEAGFEVCACSYVNKETVNHKEGISAPRIFIQAKLRKPVRTKATRLGKKCV